MSRKTAFVLVIIGVVMVSYSGPLVKGALLAGASPASVAFLRMALSALMLLPLALKKEANRQRPLGAIRRTGRRQLFACLGAAACLAGHYLTWMTSLSATSTFASVALVCTQPLFVAAFSGLLLHEPMPPSARPGALVALLGAALIGLNSLTGQGGGWAGDLLALAGAALMAGHWLIGRYARRTLPAMGYTFLVYALTAGLLLTALPLLGGLVFPAAAWPYLMGLVLGSTLLGHTLFTTALGAVPAEVISFALLGEPVGAMLWAMVFFHEIPSPLVALGGGVVLLGLCLYLRAGMNPGLDQGARSDAAQG